MKPKTAPKPKARPKIALLTAARDFFSTELRTVMQKRHVEAKKDSFDYLVQLLLRFMESDQFFAVSNGKK